MLWIAFAASLRGLLFSFDTAVISGAAHNWQYMLGSETIPTLLFALLLFTVPESTHWPVSHGEDEKAEIVFLNTGEIDIKGEMAAIEESFNLESTTKREGFFQK